MLERAWKTAIVALLLIAASGGVRAADGGRFGITAWQTEQGLPQNSVIAMTQTGDGYLWLGTLGGLVRFDGIEFTVFDENNTPGLESSRIVYLFEDSQGNLWIGTETAGVFLAKKNQPVIGLEIGRGSAEGRLVAAAEDASGGVWLYTASGQLYRYRDGTVDAFSDDRLTPYSSQRSLASGESGHLLVSTDQQVWAIPPVTEKPQRLPLKRIGAFGKLDWLMASPRGGFWYLHDLKIEKWSSNGRERELGEYPWNWAEARVSAACEDGEGNLIVGTLGAGVFWFDFQGKATPISTEQGLSSDFILALHMDSEGALWVATDGGGLNRVIRQAFDVLPPSRGKSVQSVCADGHGGMWLGYAGLFGGVDHWIKSEVVQYGIEYKLPVRAVLVDGNERVWAGTSGSRVGAGLFQLSPADRFEKVIPKSVESLEVAALFEDSKGRLWMGTISGLRVLEGDWREYTVRDGLSSDDVRAIAEDKEGSIWIGTRGGGLNRLRDGKFTVFRKADGLPSDKIASIYVDDKGALWIGTDGGGLARFHDGKWTQYSTREGLVSNSVGYLLEDGQGYLWMGSYAALMRVAKKDLEEFARGAITTVPLRIYGQADGLPSGECTSGSQPGACRTPDGTLWFPTIKGLAYVPVEQLRPNTNPPPVVIESVLIEGQPHRTNYVRKPRMENVTIPPGTERLEIHYTSLNLRAAERARFRYRLEGHETTWTEAGNARVARYSKLPPGDYRFQVSACNEDGVWSPAGGSLAMIVQPPFWRTWWFLTATTIVLLGGIVGTVHYFSVQKLERQLAAARQREAVEKERARIARDVHDQLGASLTQLTLLGEMVQDDKELPDEVEAHARQICQAARDTTRSLDEIVWTVNPANDTLEGLVNYICKYAQDYLEVAGLRPRLELPAQVPGATIAPEVRHNVFLAAKEALTNVVRHAKASAVWLRLHVRSGRATLEIADDGKGLAGMDEKRAATRHGLRNMEQRMRDIGGGFEMSAAAEGGLRVRLTVPIQIRN